MVPKHQEIPIPWQNSNADYYHMLICKIYEIDIYVQDIQGTVFY